MFSYVSSESQLIKPIVFSSTYLEERHRSDYKKYLEENGVGTRPFLKDNQYIDATIRKMIIEFENDVQIIAPSEAFEENVFLEDIEDGTTKATIQSKIRKM